MSSTTQPAPIEEVLTFWFGELQAFDDVDRSKQALWWKAGDDTDREIRERFAGLVEQALVGGLDEWQQTARGSLALVIVLDQFTRTLGRGTAKAFVGDDKAVAVCLAAIERDYDSQLRPVERSFLYMPMMHAEDASTAQRCVETFRKLSEEIQGLAEGYPDFHGHAVQHADIVLEFGRYPHRNELLGREPTQKEQAFLAAGGPTFGQKK